MIQLFINHAFYNQLTSPPKVDEKLVLKADLAKDLPYKKMLV